MNIVETQQPRPSTWNCVLPRTEPRELEPIRKIEESIAYMMRHLDRPLQASTLAAQANISLSHFFTLFKRYVGSTPMDYFIRLRLRRACHLLENTEMSVKAIAYTLGYDDPYYFSRIFKSFNRISPRQYRLLKNGAGKPERDGESRIEFPTVPQTGYNGAPSLCLTSTRLSPFSAALERCKSDCSHERRMALGATSSEGQNGTPTEKWSVPAGS
jgi:AraC-like DNA-binding protein